MSEEKTNHAIDILTLLKVRLSKGNITNDAVLAEIEKAILAIKN